LKALAIWNPTQGDDEGGILYVLKRLQAFPICNNPGKEIPENRLLGKGASWTKGGGSSEGWQTPLSIPWIKAISCLAGRVPE